jgi:rhodanese-related sulfurtransferase
MGLLLFTQIINQGGDKMKKAEKIFVLTLAVVFALSGAAFALDQTVYPIKGKHKGQNITPVEAYKMLKSKPNVYLVDVRTRIEYQDIGHPVGAYNVPWKFYTTKVGKKGYKKVVNQNFGKDLLARFNPKTDTLLLLCRSAKRTIAGSTAAVDAGFKPENVYNVLGGFEGDKVKDKKSPFYGRRQVGGWRLEGLPWTYKMDQKLMYQPDVK